MAISSIPGRVRFGVFEVDFASGELRKQGIKIKLHEQPLKVLGVLLEHPGQVVAREQLCRELWPAGTFVDSEVGLNSAVKKLRDALGDSAANARFIETLPRRGYRWIGEATPVEATRAGIAEPAIKAEAGSSAEQAQAVASQPEGAAAWKARASILWKAALALVALCAAVAGGWWFFRPKQVPYSIAVLPLKNLSPDGNDEYFSDGLTDEIVSNLSVIDGLQVKSRTSSFAFKDKPRDIHAVGEQLGVKYVLEGSVLRDGERMRINVQLVRVADDQPMWSSRYDRELKDVFAVQDEISLSIVNELRLKLGRGQRRYNTNLTAYDLYLRAREMTGKNPGVDSALIEQSIPLFEAAIGKDPNFAPAYAGIADAYAYLSATPRTFDPKVANMKMRAACEKAQQLDPMLAEAYSCMGLVYSRDYEWPNAEKAFGRAIELNANLARPHKDLATWVLLPQGRFQEAEQEVERALELDPLSLRMLNLQGLVFITGGHYDEVFASSRRTLAMDPDNYFARQHLGRALVQKGDLKQGIDTLEKLGVGTESYLGFAYAKAGRRAEAEQIAAQHPDWPWAEALVYAGLGDKDKAVEGLARMAAIEDPRTGFYSVSPEFSLLRSDPRFKEIRRQLGLPDVR